MIGLTVLGMCFLWLGTIVAWVHLEGAVSGEDAARTLGIPVLERVPAVDLKKTTELELLRDSSHQSRRSGCSRTYTIFAAAG